MKKFFKVLLVIMMTCCSFNLNYLTINAAVGVEYEIYPKPHSIEYQNGEYVMRNSVNIVYDETIDEATKKHLTEVLESKNKEISISSEKVVGKMNIFAATDKSGGNAETYVTANYDIDESLFQKHVGHQMISNNDEIIIIGKDSDAVFSGITSLKHIFNQIDGSTIRDFVIKDYSDTNIRGFIEGYYGIPWTNEDRMSLMKFGGDFKMSAYVFAPKNDVYHTSKWRELYPENELNAIKEMVQVGIDSKCKFVWTAHPFMGGFNASKKDEEIASLLNKFEQLYSAGVRQFGVLGDDVGNLNRAVVIDVMKAVSEWGKEKGDVYDPVFCPGGYNDSWQGDYSELNDYDAGFPEDVQIFWTGQAVCQPVEQLTLNNFKTKNLPAGREPRRSPLFWLNWPVNDINGGRLMMGKGSLLHTDINVDDVVGVVTNPMQEAEASKPALFAVADYSWNVKDFDDDKSWEDSFKYIDEDAGEYLHTLAKHMSNPQPNGHGLILDESAELQPLINQFKTALENDDADGIKNKGTLLIKEMQTIIEACDGFNADSKNANLKDEMEPFIGSLKDLASAIKNYTEASIALKENDSTTAFNRFTNGTADFNKSKKHNRKNLSGTNTVSPGSTHLIPLATKIQETISDDIANIVNGTDDVLKITASSSFTSFYGGKIEDIIDGNLTTSAWHDGYEAVGQYFQVNLSIPTTIYGVDILNGTTGKPQDTFGYAKVKYSTDNGTTWKDMIGTAYGEYLAEVKISGISIDKVTNVRYECTQVGSGNKWPAMREFKVLTSPSATTEFTLSVLDSPEGWDNPSNRTNMIDGDDSTGVHFTVRQGGTPNNTTIPGDWVGVKTSQQITLGKIRILQGLHDTHGDYFKDADLEYSNDGSTWTKIKTYKDKRTIEDDLSDQNIKCQYLRLKNNVTQNTWIAMREFQVKEKIFFNGNAYTNVDAYKTIKTNSLDDMGVLATPVDISLNKDQYIGIQLKRIHELKEVFTALTTGNLTLQVSKNGFEWDKVEAGKLTNEARYVRLINLTNEEVTCTINEFVVYTNEIEDKKLDKIQGFGNYENSALKALDSDWTTAAIYSGSQNSGSNFVYDLGQEITLNSFKAVCRDGEIDFPRHGKFSVSSDGNTWNDIMTLGNTDSENPGESTNADDINYVLPVHEISYNTKEVTDLNEKVRYIKFQITRTKTGSDKWVRFQEFVINGGEFLKEENNPTIESTSKETKESLYKNMLDGNLSTMFMPEDNSGSFTYSVSSKNETLNTIQIIQDSNKISNAIVKARMLSATRGTEWITLGSLNQTINEFVLPANTTVLDVKVEWTNTQIGISKFALSTKTDITIDKTELQTLLNNVVDTSTWTKSSKAVYEQAIETGKQVNASTGASQTSIDSAILLINTAVSNKVIKGNTTALQTALNAAITQSSKYTASTWKTYSKVLEKANLMMENKDDLDQTEIDGLLADITNSQKALVFNPTNRETAIITSLDMDQFIQSITKPEDTYTVDSYKAFTERQKELKALIDADKVEPQDPEIFATANKKVIDAKTAIVSVKTIPSLIKEFEAVNEDIYTVESFTAYQKAIEEATKLLKNGTEATIDKAISDIGKVKEELELKAGDKTELVAYIADLEKLLKDDYTQKTYKALTDLITDVKSKMDTSSNLELAAFIVDLKNCKDDLISVVNLKAIVKQAKAYDSGMYTVSSYEVVKEEIAKAEKLFIAGTATKIQESESSLKDSMNKLQIRVNEEEAKNYIESLTKMNEENYTEESYATYLNAFNALKDMLTHLDDVASIDYLQAKETYDNAYQGLVSNSEQEKVELEAYIKSLEKLSKDDYTKKSYQFLTNLIADIKSKIDDASSSLLTTYKKDLETAKNNLVSISNLKAAIKQAKTFDSKTYTTSTFNALKKEIEKAEKLLANGSKEDILASEKGLSKSIKNLNNRVNESDAKKYIDSLTKVNGAGYDKKSYDNYVKAFDTLKNMLNNLDDVSTLDYIYAKEALDKAYKALKETPVTNPGHVQTGDSSNTGLLATFGLLALGLVFALRKKTEF